MEKKSLKKSINENLKKKKKKQTIGNLSKKVRINYQFHSIGLYKI